MSISSVASKGNAPVQYEMSAQEMAEILMIDNKILSLAQKAAYIAFASIYGKTLDTVRVDYNAFRKLTGCSPDTTSKAFKDYHKQGLVLLKVVNTNGPDGRRNNYTFVTPTKQFHDLKSFVPNTFRQHGGATYKCPHCQSVHVRFVRIVSVRKEYTCMDCGAVDNVDAGEYRTDMNPVKLKMKKISSQKVDPQLEEPKQKCTMKSDTQLEKPIEKHLQKWKSSTNSDPQLAGNINHTRGVPADAPTGRCEVSKEAFDCVARVLTSDSCINMKSSGDEKYINLKHPAFPKNLAGHFAGTEMLGTTIADDPKHTSMFIADADTAEHWDILKETARVAAAYGYKPLLEPSPVGDRGHLVLIFDDFVDGRAVHQSLVKLNPDFANIKEVWPRNKNRVRLPGGFYSRNGINQWCFLHDAYMVRLSNGGASGAEVLYENQSHAKNVPDYIEEKAPIERKNHDKSSKNTTIVDKVHKIKYPDSNFIAEFCEKRLVAYFNDTTKCEELNPSVGRNGKALAHWRGESTPSVELYADNTWADFGGFCEDGSFDGGDAFELYCRVNDLTRSESLRIIGKQFVVVITGELKTAAKAGAPIPQWLSEYCQITQRGYDLYRKTAILSGQKPHPQQEETVSQASSQEDDDWLSFFEEEAA